ncbi:MAG TPA: recombinase family protein [Candidatus Methanomethylia archaeon]|nr:recombinase family protein [Candidatus Methanomethylicia archaeon]
MKKAFFPSQRSKVGVEETALERKRAVAYLRVSTDEQTVENQRLAIEKWAQESGYMVLKYYVDEATSGNIPPLKRRGFREMMEELSKMTPKPQAVLVYELSRVGRTFYETLEAVKTLEELGTPLISISPKESFLQSMDPSIRKLILAIITWVAEREREVISQRTREGMVRVMSQGRHVGRPRMEVDVEKALQLLREGWSLSAIARKLGVSISTLRRRLKEVKITD